MKWEKSLHHSSVFSLSSAPHFGVFSRGSHAGLVVHPSRELGCRHCTPVTFQVQFASPSGLACGAGGGEAIAGLGVLSKQEWAGKSTEWSHCSQLWRNNRMSVKGKNRRGFLTEIPQLEGRSAFHKNLNTGEFLISWCIFCLKISAAKCCFGWAQYFHCYLVFVYLT